MKREPKRNGRAAGIGRIKDCVFALDNNEPVREYPFLMKVLKCIFGPIAGGLLMVGCCSQRQITPWEYKVTGPPQPSNQTRSFTTEGVEARRMEAEQFMNELGKEGWIFVQKEEQTGRYIFKRLKPHVHF
jgi:hypothetical protein